MGRVEGGVLWLLSLVKPALVWLGTGVRGHTPLKINSCTHFTLEILVLAVSEQLLVTHVLSLVQVGPGVALELPVLVGDLLALGCCSRLVPAEPAVSCAIELIECLG